MNANTLQILIWVFIKQKIQPIYIPAGLLCIVTLTPQISNPQAFHLGVKPNTLWGLYRDFTHNLFPRTLYMMHGFPILIHGQQTKGPRGDLYSGGYCHTMSHNISLIYMKQNHTAGAWSGLRLVRLGGVVVGVVEGDENVLRLLQRRHRPPADDDNKMEDWEEWSKPSMYDRPDSFWVYRAIGFTRYRALTIFLVVSLMSIDLWSHPQAAREAIGGHRRPYAEPPPKNPPKGENLTSGHKRFRCWSKPPAPN